MPDLPGRVRALERRQVDHRHGEANALLLGGGLYRALAERRGALLDADAIDVRKPADHPLEYGEGRDRHNRRAMARATVIVMDACGVGALPDAADYGDAGSNTLGHLAERVGGLDLPTLGRLGLGSIIPIEGVPPAAHPVIHGRLHPLGPGKESTTGHWELMGVIPD